MSIFEEKNSTKLSFKFSSDQVLATNSGYKIHELLGTSAWTLSIHRIKTGFLRLKNQMVQCGVSSGLNTKIEPHHFYLGFISSEPALQYQPKSDLINSPVNLFTKSGEWRSKSSVLPNLGATTQNDHFWKHLTTLAIYTLAAARAFSPITWVKSGVKTQGTYKY